MIGVIFGSGAVFLATRRFGRPCVERVVNPTALTRRADVVDPAGMPGLFVLFVLPTFPDDVLWFVVGLTDSRFRTFLILIAVGCTPTCVTAVYAGTRLAECALVGFALVLTALAITSAVGSVARHPFSGRLNRSD
jgi:uncharacterized membrane protein YdjX (TVP38/TMEM64 family)